MIEEERLTAPKYTLNWGHEYDANRRPPKEKLVFFIIVHRPHYRTNEHFLLLFTSLKVSEFASYIPDFSYSFPPTILCEFKNRTVKYCIKWVKNESRFLYSQGKYGSHNGITDLLYFFYPMAVIFDTSEIIFHRPIFEFT